MKALIDQLLLNGLDIVGQSSVPKPAPNTDGLDDSDTQADREAEEVESEDGQSTVQSILMMLTDFLDSEVGALPAPGTLTMNSVMFGQFLHR